MKKLIYISGLACANLMLFGSLFKIMHWPGASVLLVLATFLFCFLFLPSALVSSYQSQEDKKYKLLHVITFVVFFVGVMGVLFKIMHWPGAAIFVLVGIPLPFVLFLPVYLYQTRENKKTTSTNFLGVMFGLIFLAVFSVLLAMNISKNVLNNAADNSMNADSYATFNSSKLKSASASSIKKSADELCAYIDNLKCELLKASENNGCNGNVIQPDYSPMNIINKDNTSVTSNILFGRSENRRVDELKAKILEYKNSILSTEKVSPELKNLASTLFDVNDITKTNNGDEWSVSWEQREFPSGHLIVVIDALSQIQSNVRLVESESVL